MPEQPNSVPVQTNTVNDPKCDYIIRSFGHTHHKRYENYVVTGIWHRLRAKKLLIKPITQQFIMRPDNRYALLDLYFPAINFAVECDEGQHFDENGEYIPNDRLREYHVMRVLSALPIRPTLLRVDATRSLQEIDSKLDEVVRCIEEKSQGKTPEELWPEDISAADFLTQNKRITIADPVLFRIIDDILNAFGFRAQNGQEYRGYQHSTRRINANETFCFISMIRQMGEARYANVWHEETQEIFEYERGAEDDNDWQNLIDRKDDVFRYIFCRIEDSLGNNGYKFYGKFKLDKEMKIRHWKDESGNNYRYIVWKRVEDEIGLNVKEREAPQRNVARLNAGNANAAGGRDYTRYNVYFNNTLLNARPVGKRHVLFLLMERASRCETECWNNFFTILQNKFSRRIICPADEVGDSSRYHQERLSHQERMDGTWVDVEYRISNQWGAQNFPDLLNFLRTNEYISNFFRIEQV